MSYYDFLELIFTPIRYFCTWLNSMATMLSHNYYFITILGLVLFISLFWLFWNFIFDYIDSINKKYDDFNDKYENYKLFKLAQAKYLNNYRLDEFNFLTDKKVLNEQVNEHIFHNNVRLNTKSNNNEMDFRTFGQIASDNGFIYYNGYYVSKKTGEIYYIKE